MVGAQNLKFVLVFTCAMAVLQSRFCTSQRNGGCGAYAVCDPQGSPICTCLPGLDLCNNQEWDSGNWSSGCRRTTSLNCGKSGNLSSDRFLGLPIRMNMGFSKRWFGPGTLCEARCLRNCSCLAYGFQNGSECMLWSGTLIEIHKISNGSASHIFIRVSNSELVADQKKGPDQMIIILSAVILVVLSIIIYFSWRWISEHRADSSLQLALAHVTAQDLPLFKFEKLAKATNNFSESNKLGKGGFGPVYKGKLANGREIAVKRLSQASGQGIQEFMNEVVLITKLQHRNLVRLIGCCVEDKEMMLIYEYMPNKSLDFFFYSDILDWRKRFNIIEGICRGLLYLHRDSRLRIIHRDLKPSNILLDNDWNPKISDFGMARIYGTKQDHVSTLRVVGTYGYMAPEYAIEGRFSEKSDVFSLGVLVLEIAAGRRNSSFNHQDDEPSLMAHVWKLWTKGNVVASIDPRISSPENDAEVIRWMHIGLLCVQELPRERPSVSCVLSMLGSEIAELPKPKHIPECGAIQLLQVHLNRPKRVASLSIMYPSPWLKTQGRSHTPDCSLSKEGSFLLFKI